MRPQTYAIALVLMALGISAVTVGTNVYLDPEGVFGLNPSPRNPNDRYARFVQYLADEGAYDALIFGSSRADGGVPPEVLSPFVGQAKVANFAVGAGTMTDHLPALEYIVRTRRGLLKPIRHVLLLLDIDLFGLSQTNRNIQSLLAPQLRGESVWRFKWRYLTAVQPDAWRDAVRHLPHGSAGMMFGVGAASAAPADKAADVKPAAEHPNMPSDLPIRPTQRVQFGRQLDQLWTFVALCRREGIDLVVAFSPLGTAIAGRLDQADAAEIERRVAEIVPVWVFGAPQWLSDERRLWLDDSHFTPEVGRMMLERIYEGKRLAAHPDFGELRN